VIDPLTTHALDRDFVAVQRVVKRHLAADHRRKRIVRHHHTAAGAVQMHSDGGGDLISPEHDREAAGAELERLRHHHHAVFSVRGLFKQEPDQTE
jgi:hypothetical protein